jgi:hypothetical protein
MLPILVTLRAGEGAWGRVCAAASGHENPIAAVLLPPDLETCAARLEVNEPCTSIQDLDRYAVPGLRPRPALTDVITPFPTVSLRNAQNKTN